MRSILTRFRISAHKLEIETGRYTTPKHLLKTDYVSSVIYQKLKTKNIFFNKLS